MSGSPVVGGGEALAEPTRSASLPLNALYSSSSDGSGETSSSATAKYNTVGGFSEDLAPSPPTSSARVAAAASRISVAPESPSSRPFSTSRGLSARRFLSDPPPPASAPEGARPATQAAAKTQRKPSRVSSLARWYDRLSSGQQRGPGSRQSRQQPQQLQQAAAATAGHGRTVPMHATSLPSELDPGFSEGPSSPVAEIARLRAALQAEKSARTEAEAQSLSLQNALRNSKRKVDAQKQRIDELSDQLAESVAALAPVQEILAIAERNFFRKEQTLKKIIAAQQEKPGGKSMRSTPRSREKRSRYIIEADL